MKNILIAVLIIAVLILGGSILYFSFDSSNSSTANAKTSITNDTNSVTTPINKKINSANSDNKNVNSINTSENNESHNKNYVNHSQNTESKTNSFEMAKSNGNFADIVNGSNYMEGSINGVSIIIPLVGGKVVNNQLVLNEYYTSRLNEVFTAKISSIGDNNFILYEFYNGEHTATFKLRFFNNEGQESLGGTFTHAGSNEVTGITFNLISNQACSLMTDYPFYEGTVGGTNVTIVSVPSTNSWLEKYSGDNNVFQLNYDWNVGKTLDGIDTENKLILRESFNGKTTGYYILNTPYDPSEYKNYNYTGYFISASNNATSSVSLSGINTLN